jgi:hypothetical protein
MAGIIEFGSEPWHVEVAKVIVRPLNLVDRSAEADSATAARKFGYFTSITGVTALSEIS